jgi:hypothetical protein
MRAAKSRSMAPIEATSADEFLFFKHSLSKLSRLLFPSSCLLFLPNSRNNNAWLRRRLLEGAFWGYKKGED